MAARQFLPQPGVLLPELRVLHPQFRSQPLPALVRLQHSCQDIPQPRVSIRLREHASHGRHETQQTPQTPESRIPRPRVAAPPTPRLVNSTHKISDYLPGQSSSTPADAFFCTLDRVDNEKN